MESSTDSKTPFNDSSAANTNEIASELAAVLVYKALNKQELDSTAWLSKLSLESEELKKALWAFHVRNRLKFTRSICLLFFVAVTLFEPPLWCTPEQYFSDNYHTYRLHLFQPWQTALCDIVIASFLATDMILWHYEAGVQHVWGNPVGLSSCICLVVVILDSVFSFGLSCRTMRVSSYARLLFTLSYDSERRRELNMLFESAFEIGTILVFLIIFVLVFSWQGLVLFSHDSVEEHSFKNITMSTWSMTVLLTTNNYPDVMLPGYRENRMEGVFFIVYLMLGLWLLVQMLTSVIYNSYQRGQEESRFEYKSKVQAIFGDAFIVLDRHRQGWLEPDQVLQFLDKLSVTGNQFTLGSMDKREFFLRIINENHDNKILREEFGKLAQALNLQLTDITKPWFHANFPQYWDAWGCSKWQQFVQGDLFDRIINVLLFLSFVISVIETWPAMTGHADRMAAARISFFDIIDMLFTFLFFAEMGMKIVLMGWSRYWTDGTNRFDAIITVLAVLGLVHTFVARESTFTFAAMKLAVLVRTVRLIRLIGNIRKFQVILRAIGAAWPGIVRDMPILGCVLLLFGVLGGDLFGGLITTDPTSPHALLLKGTTFAKSEYFPLNFNDRFSGVVMLFSCLVMNSWDVYVEAFASVAGWVAYVFFLLWWITGTYIGLNIIIAIIIDAFISQWKELNSEDGLASTLTFQDPTGEFMVKHVRNKTLVEVELADLIPAQKSDTLNRESGVLQAAHAW